MTKRAQVGCIFALLLGALVLVITGILGWFSAIPIPISSATPTPDYRLTPVIKGAVTPPSEEWANKTLPPGWEGVVPGGVTCSGDLLVEGEPWYDQDPATGLVVFFTQTARVEAPYGAHCAAGDWRQIKEAELRKWGCENGCADVDVRTYP